MSPHAAITAEVRHRLRELLMAFTRSQLVFVAAQLGLADHLARGPLTAPELATLSGSHPDALHRLLRGLATIGVVTDEGDGTFALTPLGDALRADRPGSLRDIAVAAAEEWYPAWGELRATVQDGETAFVRVHGMPFFEWMQAHPAQAARFNRRMTLQSAETAAAVLAVYDARALRQVVDVGGGQGVFLATLLRALPTVRGLLFDLPHVVPEARAYLDEAGVGGRCEVIGGDFFTAVPAGADTYLLSQVLHDWDDAACLRILRHIREAMAPGGRVLAIEAVLPERVTGPSFAVDQDLLMMVLVGGRERTKAQYAALFAAAGLNLTQVIPTGSARDASVLEAHAV